VPPEACAACTHRHRRVLPASRARGTPNMRPLGSTTCPHLAVCVRLGDDAAVPLVVAALLPLVLRLHSVALADRAVAARDRLGGGLVRGEEATHLSGLRKAPPDAAAGSSTRTRGALPTGWLGASRHGRSSGRSVLGVHVVDFPFFLPNRETSRPRLKSTIRALARQRGVLVQSSRACDFATVLGRRPRPLGVE
jgi:hypothetical protein